MNRHISRRSFLEASGLALTAAGLGEFPLAAQGRLFAYVGRSTPGFAGASEGGGVDVFRVNMADGSLQPASSTGPEVQDLNSDGMCVSADGRFLYWVNRTTALGGIPGTGGGVVAFAINRADGSLRHLNTRPSMGAMPISVKIDISLRPRLAQAGGKVVSCASWEGAAAYRRTPPRAVLLHHQRTRTERVVIPSGFGDRRGAARPDDCHGSGGGVGPARRTSACCTSRRAARVTVRYPNPPQREISLQLQPSFRGPRQHRDLRDRRRHRAPAEGGCRGDRRTWTEGIQH
ncbi:MAG: beta-propeller fold lactonase family protein [Acidobacteria bacterium]|nr:beta-propeller fold lactonase family protein [Acidobacteriota bacterium]